MEGTTTFASIQKMTATMKVPLFTEDKVVVQHQAAWLLDGNVGHYI